MERTQSGINANGLKGLTITHSDLGWTTSLLRALISSSAGGGANNQLMGCEGQGRGKECL